MATGKRFITEAEKRVLAREEARRLKAKTAAEAREAKLKALGYRTFTAPVPAEIHAAVKLAVNELVSKWIKAHRRAELMRPEETDPLTNALRAAIANVDVSGLGPQPKGTRSEQVGGSDYAETGD